MNTSTRLVVLVSLICVFAFVQTSAGRNKVVSEENQARKLKTITKTTVNRFFRHPPPPYPPSATSYVKTPHNYLPNVVNRSRDQFQCYDGKKLRYPVYLHPYPLISPEDCARLCKFYGYCYADFYILGVQQNCWCSNYDQIDNDPNFVYCDLGCNNYE